MAGTLFVVNPNSLEAVTDAIRHSLASMPLPLAVQCVTTAAGPPGIVTQSDADFAIGPLRELVEQLAPSAAGFVVACFSDPGLHGLREVVRVPVMGLCESGLLTACTLGHRIGVLAIASAAIPRHLRYYAAMGLASRVVAERALDLAVAAGADPQAALPRLLEVGARLRDEDGAQVLILGCASLGGLRGELEQALGVPVVDPCRAAAGMACAAWAARH